MGVRLPSVRPREVVRVLEKAGFVQKRQTGSHLIMANMATQKIVPVPIHARELKRGLLMSIIKQSGLTQKQFRELL